MTDKHDLPGFKGLEVIAAFKFLQAAGLILAGLGAFGLMHPAVSDFAQEWLERLAVSKRERFAVAAATRALPLFAAATPRHFAVIGTGLLLYACVFLTEGIGLWRGKKWAEYLTIAVTASLLPLEGAALWNRVTLVRVLTLLINTLVIAYLVWELRARQRQEAMHAHGGR
ncbi:MAG TPA: DUF2127 domain-containing protein [Gemmatimonadaceae bacterium]|jgi:uncharacterized membrane protein (DUF2068 family)|nr:DUF2127 domain-containing protein [Gemmatimonadaceae bacterium]